MPVQCPECARFLSRQFVTDLAAAPAACPRCGVTLTADRVGGGAGAPADPTPGAGSVRPPDLPEDPLARWDQDAEVVDLSRWRPARRRLDLTGSPVAVGIVGAAVGASLARGRRGRGAFVGAVVAMVGTALAGSASRR